MRFIISLFFLLPVLSVSSQTGTITGTVRTADQQPAEFVTIALKDTRKAVTVDKNGIYHIKNLAAGTYTVQVSFAGLKSLEKSVVVAEGSTAVADFILVENERELEQVVVTSHHNRYLNKNASGSLRITTPLLEVPQNIQVLSGEVLKDQQVISMSDGLIRNVSGLTRLEHWGDLYTNISARGSQVQAFRNGFNVVSSYWGPLTEDMSFVERVEFVKGPAGFMLSSGDPSGLYNVVTKKPTGQAKGEASFS